MLFFNLGRENEGFNCKLKSLSGSEDVEIKRIQFRRSSVAKISDIMIKGVQRDNQDLVVDQIIFDRTEYDKLTDKRYKLTCNAISDAGNNYVIAIEFTLGNIDINFNVKNVEFDDEYVYINLAHIVVYPMGICSFKELSE